MFTHHKYLGTLECERIYDLLKSIARQGKPPIGYGVIFDLMGLQPGNHAAKEAGHLLGEISAQMHFEGKPMLSALVINQKQGMPGPGFFGLAVSLKKLRAGATKQKKRAFWEEELRAVYSTQW